MTLLRNDGTVTVFVLKHKQKDGTWALSSMDHFKFSGTKTDRQGCFTAGAKRHFMASGECWQRHGIHGVLDRSIGLEGLREIAEANPGYEFALFSLELSQKSSCIATMHLAEATA